MRQNFSDNWSTILKREYSLKDILLAHVDIYNEYPKFKQYLETSKIKITRADAFTEFVQAYLSGNKLSTKLRMSLKKLASNKNLKMPHSTMLNNVSITGRVKPFPFKVNDYDFYYTKNLFSVTSVILVLISKNDIKIYLYRLVVNFSDGSAVATWKGDMLFIGNKFEDLNKLTREIMGINAFARRFSGGFLSINIKTRYVDDKGQAYIADSRVPFSIQNPTFNHTDKFNDYVDETRKFWDEKLKFVDSDKLTRLKTTPGVSE